MRRLAVLAVAAGVLHGSACGSGLDPAAELCARVLARRIPAARIVDADPTPLAAAIDFEIGGDWWTDATNGSLWCTFDAGDRGGLRLREATLNGVAFTTAEITVINAELLLAEMRQADRKTRTD